MFSNSIFAAGSYIARDATITAVGNTYGSGDNFIVNIIGGSNGTWQGQNITFKLVTVTMETIHARGYSTALTAFTSGHKVSIWSADGTCEGANHIMVSK